MMRLSKVSPLPLPFRSSPGFLPDDGLTRKTTPAMFTPPSQSRCTHCNIFSRAPAVTRCNVDRGPFRDRRNLRNRSFLRRMLGNRSCRCPWLCHSTFRGPTRHNGYIRRTGWEYTPRCSPFRDPRRHRRNRCTRSMIARVSLHHLHKQCNHSTLAQLSLHHRHKPRARSTHALLKIRHRRKQYIRSSHARGTIQTPHNRYNRVDLSRLPPPLERSSQGVPGAIAPLELRDQAI